MTENFLKHVQNTVIFNLITKLMLRIFQTSANAGIQLTN